MREHRLHGGEVLVEDRDVEEAVQPARQQSVDEDLAEGTARALRLGRDAVRALGLVRQLALVAPFEHGVDARIAGEDLAVGSVEAGTEGAAYVGRLQRLQQLRL